MVIQNLGERHVYSCLAVYTLSLLQFQPGAVEGTVELTPLAHAAGKGLQGIVELLIDSGANVNYLCSVRDKTSLWCECSTYVTSGKCPCKDNYYTLYISVLPRIF